MAAPFVAHQARTSAAVIRHLANARAIVDGEEISGVYERQHGEINGMAATFPTFLLQSSEVAAKHIQRGTQIRIPQAGEAAWGSQEWYGGTLFNVTGLEPDGAGLTLLILEAP
ncbi:MAG TPA: hypothetical protein VGE22_12325 [Solimonas sp.]